MGNFEKKETEMEQQGQGHRDYSGLWKFQKIKENEMEPKKGQWFWEFRSERMKSNNEEGKERLSNLGRVDIKL